MVALEPIIASSHGRGEGSPVVIVTAHKGGDVTVACWQVGQQVAHFRDAPSFPASSWKRCHPSRAPSDSWEWNELRNQSHILTVNISSSRWLAAGWDRQLNPCRRPHPHPHLIYCRMGSASHSLKFTNSHLHHKSKKNTWLFYLTSCGWNIHPEAPGDCRPSHWTSLITKSFETSSNSNLWTKPNTFEFRMLSVSLIFHPSGRDRPTPTCNTRTFPPPFTCTLVQSESVFDVKNMVSDSQFKCRSGWCLPPTARHKRCMTASTRVINQSMTLWFGLIYIYIYLYTDICICI